LALKLGDRLRIARGLTWEAAIAASQSPRGKKRSQYLFSICRRIVAESGDPYTSAMLALTEGQQSFSHARWRQALVKFEETEALFQKRCTGVSFEMATLQSFRLQTLVYMGDYQTVRNCLPDLLEIARSAGDLYLETFIRGAIEPLLLLAEDNPDQSRASITKALAGWSAPGYHLQHALIDQVLLSTEIYSGRGKEAEKLIGRRWALQRTALLYNQNLRAKMLEVRARCSLAAAIKGAGDRGVLQRTEGVLKKLEHENEAYFAGCTVGLRAVLAKLRGDDTSAAALLGRAVEALDRWEMSDYAASASYVLSEWLGEPQGVSFRNRAMDWFTAQGIQNPERWARMRLPLPQI
jgi:hypothetical protein